MSWCDTRDHVYHLLFHSVHEVYLHTAYGDSATCYGGGLSQHPFQGVCQGNGTGLPIWLALSLCLIYMLHQFGSPNHISRQPHSQVLLWCVLSTLMTATFLCWPPLTSIIREFYKLCNTTWTFGKAEWKPLGVVHYLQINAPGVVCSTIFRLASGNYIPHKPTQLP